MLSDAIADMLGISPQPGTEWTIPCPSPTHNDARPSASIYVGEPSERMRGGKLTWRMPGMWICYSCGARGRVTSDAIETYEAPASRNLQVAEEMLAASDVHLYPESWLDYFDYFDGIHPYWLGRFSERTCWKHRLGYDFDTESGTYPLRDTSGHVLGVVRRDLTGTRPWKYKYPTGIDIGTLMYGYSEAVALGRMGPITVVLTEGAPDAIAIDEAIDAAEGEWVLPVAALAIYGSMLRPAQATLLKRLWPRYIVCAFDNDEAGEGAYESVVEALPDFVISRLEFAGKDVAELSVADRISALVHAPVA